MLAGWYLILGHVEAGPYFPSLTNATCLATRLPLQPIEAGETNATQGPSRGNARGKQISIDAGRPRGVAVSGLCAVGLNRRQIARPDS